MTGFSQSALLQALGWATLNSFWQVGLLWCAFVLCRRWLPLSARHQYGIATASLLLALLSFGGSLSFYLAGGVSASSPNSLPWAGANSWFQSVLTAASITYLLLLAVPASRLVHNWRLLRRLRRAQLVKAPVQYRLYVQKVAWHLGVRKPVQVYLSALVQSPLTIGYLKPLILLPVAGFNQLTTQQAEAILLHELAHIRRYDYLVNIAISIIHTLLYFNPFVRMFVRVAESGREECCDGMVLQFGYDRLAYAGALLQLEKTATTLPVLALGATGKSQLVSRIEAIVGIPRKMPRLKMQHFTGLFASVLAVLALHSLFVVAKKEGAADPLQAFARLGSSFTLVLQDPVQHTETAASKPESIIAAATVVQPAPAVGDAEAVDVAWMPAPPPPAPDPAFIQVAQVEEPMDMLGTAEQQQVTATVDATRKVLTEAKWKELEAAMADGLSEEEKEQAYRHYQEQVASVNWQQIEQHLASKFEQMNWEKLNQQLKAANQLLRLDSLEQHYSQLLKVLKKPDCVEGSVALPDQSCEDLKQLQQQIRVSRDSIKSIRLRPVVRF